MRRVDGLTYKELYTFSFEVKDRLVSRFIERIETYDSMGGNEIVFLKDLPRGKTLIVFQRCDSYPYIITELKKWLEFHEKRGKK